MTDTAVPAQPTAGVNAAPDQPRPVAGSGKRIASLDFIRGLAVMGILAANITVFGQPMVAYTWPGGFLVPTGDPDGWMWALQFVLIDGKMRGLFTLLFGAGIYLFLEKAWERGRGRGLQARRLAFLLLFGLIHFFFIWKGDILTGYALCGFAALLFVRMKPVNQLVLGLLGYFLGALAFAALFAGMYSFDRMEPADAETAAAQVDMRLLKTDGIADGETETALISSGDYTGFIAHNFAEHWSDPLTFVFQIIFETLPLILIGMALYRMGLFDGRMAAHKVRRWGWIGLLGGGALSAAIAWWTVSEGLTYFGTMLAFVGLAGFANLPMVLGLAALLSLAGARASSWLAERVSAAGRAAFSNYIGTSVVMLFVFHGWAGGLFGELNRPQHFLVVMAVWVLILAWSKPWLDRFAYGPLEWLWRCLTYGRLFPLRR
ncbi:hypothetical protein A9995_10200 [Erythrobacter sp. QSSC1-22B]|uniref:DUF418 domain-containing protein n=1 Tax=Erythrobacter sp. QSSC1-22B TaxID=1860125 RepID=UPI00080513C6|nr:DUF418 domain-containing protein [Erythrobacter sp. QSSC1-22B]OBX18911.1 hypothetical protein A9995_10200 [Erythrobacter sp. QSSC1-22B]